MSRNDETWEVLDSQTVLQHPFLQVHMERVRLPDGRVIGDWPIVNTRDYVNVFVLNEAGEALILEGYKHGVGLSSWQVMGGYIEQGEGPLEAARRELLEETGYASDEWLPLGSFVIDANRRVGIGHLFLAQAARQVAVASHGDLEEFAVRWMPLEEVSQALADGRVAVMGHALCIGLALLRLG